MSRPRPALCRIVVAAAVLFVARPASAQDAVVTSFFDGGLYRVNVGTGASTTLVPAAAGLNMTGFTPSGVTIGPDGNAYISNQLTLDAIYKYDFATSTLSMFINSSQLTPLSPTTGSYGASSLAFGSDGNLYVARSGGQGAAAGSGAVDRFVISKTSGGALTYSGTATTVASGLTSPNGLTIAGGSLFVTDRADDNGTPAGSVYRVNGYTTTPTTTTLVNKDTNVNYAAGVAVDATGRVYVADLSGTASPNGSTSRVLRYNANGTFDKVFADLSAVADLNGDGTKDYAFPSGLSFTADGKLLVAALGPDYPPEINPFGPAGPSGAVFVYDANGLLISTLLNSQVYASGVAVIPAVPEPATVLGLAAAGLGLARWRRKKS